MSGQDRVPGAAHVAPALRPNDGGFEAYAIDLDELLAAAGEPAVPDTTIKVFFARGSTPVQAAAEVIRSRATALPEQPPMRNPRGSLRDIVVPLMERPRGCSGREVRQALAWKHIPGPYFFRKWAAEAGRGHQLVEWIEDRSRRFRLSKDGAP